MYKMYQLPKQENLYFKLRDTYKFEHIPVKDIVIGESLTMEELAEELPEVTVVGFLLKPQRPAEVQVRGKLI